MKKVIANGIEWLYRPRVVYTGEYRGFNINIRYSPAAKQWRLYVSRQQGGSITYRKQFHKTIEDARQFGIHAVDLKMDKNESPYA
jgi:hypothetical protein